MFVQYTLDAMSLFIQSNQHTTEHIRDTMCQISKLIKKRIHQFLFDRDSKGFNRSVDRHTIKHMLYSCSLENINEYFFSCRCRTQYV